MPLIAARPQRANDARAQREDATRRKAATPMLFTEDRQPESGRHLAVPRTSSENRHYLPAICPMRSLHERLTDRPQRSAVPLRRALKSHASRLGGHHLRAVKERHSLFRQIDLQHVLWPFCAQDSEQKVAPAQVQQAQKHRKRSKRCWTRAAFPSAAAWLTQTPLNTPPSCCLLGEEAPAAARRWTRPSAGRRPQKLPQRRRARGLSVHALTSA